MPGQHAPRKDAETLCFHCGEPIPKKRREALPGEGLAQFPQFRLPPLRGTTGDGPSPTRRVSVLPWNSDATRIGVRACVEPWRWPIAARGASQAL